MPTVNDWTIEIDTNTPTAEITVHPNDGLAYQLKSHAAATSADVPSDADPNTEYWELYTLESGGPGGPITITTDFYTDNGTKILRPVIFCDTDRKIKQNETTSHEQVRK